jgi:hypothetical protein
MDFDRGLQWSGNEKRVGGSPDSENSIEQINPTHLTEVHYGR